MPRLFAKLAIFLVGAAALSVTSASRAEAYYNCITPTTRTMHGAGADISSSTFVDLADANITIATLAPCVRIDFAVQIRAQHPKGLKVRVVVVGTATVGFPPNAEFYTSENRFDGRMVSFVIPNFQKGNRTIKIQVLSVDGTPINIGRWTMSVHHDGAYG